MKRNQRAEQRVTHQSIHPESRLIKQTKAKMRHNLKVEVSRIGVKQQVSEKGGRFTWFRVQISHLRGLPLEFPQSTGSSEDTAESEDDEERSESEDGDKKPVPRKETENPDAVLLKGIAPLSTQEAKTLAYLYTLRGDEELKEAKASRNPPNGLIKRLQAVKEQEQRQLRSRDGFLIPRITTQEGLVALLTWNGYDNTVEKLPSMKISVNNLAPNSSEFVNPLPSLLDLITVKTLRAGVGNQKKAEELLKLKPKAPTVGAIERTKGIDEKVGAKHISTEQVLARGKLRRQEQRKTDAKKRFHQAIALSRLGK
jgi:hypothetical protein